MSSQNPAVSKATACDNEKTDDVGDCGCNSASVVASSSESTESSQKKEFFGNIDIEDQAHGIDSGFLSGPLSSNLEEQKELKDIATERISNNLSNSNSDDKIVDNTNNPTESSHCYEKAGEERCTVDSGCIEEEEEYDESNDTDAKAESQSLAQQHTQPRQQQNKTHNTTGASNNTRSHDDEMRLKHDVECHIAERFCNLSLQNEPINNLNASGKEATVEPVAAATTIQPAESNQLPAWEQCYKQNDEGDTYLHLACISGHENVVAALIRLAIHPCLLNIKNDYGQTPLHLAALTKQRRILRMLLLAGAEPTIRDRHGNTPLHLACMSGDEQCVSALTVPFSASEINEAHRQYGYRSNDKLFSSLSYACLPPDFEIRNYNDPLRYYLEFKDLRNHKLGCVELLIDCAVFISISVVWNSLAIHILRDMDGQAFPADALFISHLNNGEFCVHLAAELGHLNILSILVQYGADINAREGKGGYTPLHISIERGNEELFNFLIDDCKQKLNLEAITFGRLTAYQFACILKRSQMQSTLENHGAEPLTPPDSEYESSDDESDLEDSKSYDRFVDPGYFGNFKGGNAMAVM